MAKRTASVPEACPGGTTDHETTVSKVQLQLQHATCNLRDHGRETQHATRYMLHVPEGNGGLQISYFKAEHAIRSTGIGTLLVGGGGVACRVERP